MRKYGSYVNSKSMKITLITWTLEVGTQDEQLPTQNLVASSASNLNTIHSCNVSLEEC